MTEGHFGGLSPAAHVHNGTALGRCVGEGETFLRDYWGRVPYLHVGNESFTDLLSIADVDHIISSTLMRWPAFRMLKNGQLLDQKLYTRSTILAGTTLTDALDPARVLNQFYEGATIVLHGLQKYWSPITLFCRDIETLLTHPVQCNAYITPPHSRGLGLHYDTHDVFILQTAGSKHWSVYDRFADQPLAWERFVAERLPEEQDSKTPRLDAELAAGHCLYIPAGYLHRAESTSAISVHLTVGISTYRWYDVLLEMFNDASEEVAFREPLPVGFANDVDGMAEEVEQHLKLFTWWLDTIDRHNLAKRVADRFRSTRPPLLAGQLQQLAKVDRLTNDSLVARRRYSVVRLEAEPAKNTLLVFLNERRLEMPLRLDAVMQLIIEKPHFRVGELCQYLDEESRLVLIRRLIREGLLEILEDGWCP
jgi:bifunctional lysine-specific demethylase and histidyl-hydroxylase NO66